MASFESFLLFASKGVLFGLIAKYPLGYPSDRIAF